MEQQGSRVPDHVPAALVRDFDHVNGPAVERDSFAVYRDAPKMRAFFSPLNGGYWVLTKAEDIRAAPKAAERQYKENCESLVGGDVDPRSPHHVTTGELVVKSVEPASRVLLGAAVQHALKRLERVHTLVPSDGPSPTGTCVPRALRCGRLI